MRKRYLFKYTAGGSWPRAYAPRMGLYFVLGIGAWVWPPYGASICLVCLLALGFPARINWLRWLGRLGLAWILVVSPILVALAEPSVNAISGGLARSLSFLSLLASSEWLVHTTSVAEIRSALEFLFTIFGKTARRNLSLMISLVLVLVPWLLDEFQSIREAARVRGLSPRRPILYLSTLSSALLRRMADRARNTADALDLRS